jgi:hypothetical protein
VAPTIPLFRGEPTLSVLIRKSLGNKAQDDLKGARSTLDRLMAEFQKALIGIAIYRML